MKKCLMRLAANCFSWYKFPWYNCCEIKKKGWQWWVVMFNRNGQGRASDAHLALLCANPIRTFNWSSRQCSGRQRTMTSGPPSMLAPAVCVERLWGFYALWCFIIITTHIRNAAAHFCELDSVAVHWQRLMCCAWLCKYINTHACTFIFV